jgi:inner membrane protein YidH
MPASSSTNYIRCMGPDTSQSLALERTFLAHERTLMSWVRTSTSLISFGFTIYKFFAYLIEEEGIVPQNKRFGPREFAIAMISVGIIALVLAIVQERRAFKVLEDQSKTAYSSLAEKIAVIMAFVGFVILAAVLFRM